ncbi:unnamed protein product [Caenorhabditis angaria]|uniref:Uncharacterized protein n=1 Tax=Caenorhabditis angaria TaxID=860376 RepID=A0A9P1IGA0_9PELO|nr:unnamed protein product [Caenorhabditis angaria]
MRGLFLVSSILIFGLVIEAKNQNITVKGTTICNKKRISAKVELWEKDTLDPDDLLKGTQSSKEGEFSVFGAQDEVTSIAPYLIITHDCNVKKAGCKRISEFPIPASKIGGTYDMTYVTLDIVGAKDKEKC